MLLTKTESELLGTQISPKHPFWGGVDGESFMLTASAKLLLSCFSSMKSTCKMSLLNCPHHIFTFLKTCCHPGDWSFSNSQLYYRKSGGERRLFNGFSQKLQHTNGHSPHTVGVWYIKTNKVKTVRVRRVGAALLWFCQDSVAACGGFKQLRHIYEYLKFTEATSSRSDSYM